MFFSKIKGFIYILSTVILIGVAIKAITVTAHVLYAAPEPRVIKVGVYNNKPKVYLDENGNALGIFPEILDYIATQENWKISYIPGTWDEGLNRLEKGEIDIMVDVALSPEREARFDFAKETVLSSWGVVYVRKGSNIKSFPELDGKKVAVLKSGVYYGGPEGIDHYTTEFGAHVEFVDVKEYAEVFELLEKGEVDAAVVSRIFALTNEKNYPNIKQTDIFFNPTEIKFALTKNDSDNSYLIGKLDYWIVELKGGYGGKYQEILNNNGLSGFLGTKEVIPQWIQYVALGVGGILIIALWTIAALRRGKTNALKTLKERESLLSNIVQNTPIGVFSVNRRCMVTIAQGSALKDMRIQQGEQLDKALFAQLSKAFDGESIEIQSEIAEKMWRINVSPLTKEDKVISVVAVAVNMTSEIEFDRMKSSFLTLTAHHLRTLPSGIKWIVELLAPKIEKVLNIKEMQHWNNLKDLNGRMIELANSISRASQLELGNFYVTPETFSLPNLVDETIDELDRLWRKKKLKIVKNYGDITDITQDKTQIKAITHVLISNAMQYINSEGTITIDITHKEQTFEIKVQDTGWGIPKEQIDKVFTKMFRAENVIKMDVEGLGLGLYVVKMIVEKLQGKVWFESEENKGSTFCVELPQVRN